MRNSRSSGVTQGVFRKWTVIRWKKMQTMRTELITFQAAEGFPLDGVVCTPEAGPGALGALLVHGKVMNFYTGPCRILPPYLTDVGWTCLAMNHRGHARRRARSGAPQGEVAKGLQNRCDKR
jgi:hypothetical protein